jgi:hypothetical protein
MCACTQRRRNDFGARRNDVVVLLHFCFFACRDDFVVGQDGILRPIANRPNVANFQHSSFAACRYEGQNARFAVMPDR